MKSIVTIFFLFTATLCARDNPFVSTFDNNYTIKKPIFEDINPSEFFSDITPKKDEKAKVTAKAKLSSNETPITKKIDSAKSDTKVSTNVEKKSFLVPPIILPPTTNTNKLAQKTTPNLICICDAGKLSTKPKRKKVIHKRKKKRVKIKPKYKTIYKNYFVTIKIYGNRYKIYTKDNLIKKHSLKSPERVAFDFKRLQYFETKEIKSKNSTIKIGSHHCFWRITLHSKHNFKILKRPYGYLIY